MQRQLIFKIIVIFFLVLLLLIPLSMIHELVRERMSMRDGVVREIARSSAYNQTITGPLVVVPYQKAVRVVLTDKGSSQRYEKEDIEKGALYFFPQTFKLQGDLNVEKRYRGIYEARLYNMDNQITGSFIIPENFGIESNLKDYQFEQPFIAVGISDIRGINNDLKMVFDKQPLEITPGTEGSKLGSGIHAVLDKEQLINGGSFDYSMALKLQGTSSVSISPVGRETDVYLKSNWPHPSFDGGFLPLTRKVNEQAQGFEAHWQTNFFASDMEDKLRNCLKERHCSQFNASHFGVSLIDPVDQYLKSDRAIKYSLLFICLTFFGFFLFEIIKRLAIHPIQYSFVGIALALFFLLLLSLSEHIGFALAYLSSSIACVALIGFYVTGVLQSKKQGLGFTALLAAVYTMLYVLLNAEDYSLLMGSILVFGILAAAMIITRKLDWYKVATLPKVSFKKERVKEEHFND